MIPPKSLTAREAAAQIGVCYATVKQWILTGRIPAFKTPGGHHRIPCHAIQEVLLPEAVDSVSSGFSRQNHLTRSILEITIEGLAAKVVLNVENQRMTAILTADDVADLDLKPGDPAVVLIKAVDVAVCRP